MLKSNGCDAMTGAGESFSRKSSEPRERNGLGRFDPDRCTPLGKLGRNVINGRLALQWKPSIKADNEQCNPVRYGQNERAIALTKNALFAGHDEGAAAWGHIASLIEIAKLNGVEPYAWFMATLEAIAAGHPNERLDDLLLWNLVKPST